MTDEQQQAEPSAESDSDYSGGLAPLIIAAVIVVVTALGVFALINIDSDADDVTATETTAAATTETTAADGSSETTAAPGDGGGGAGDPVAGEATYQGTCSACHAPDATGITGLGLPLANSEFVQSMTDEELVAFIAVGRDAGDPDNTTGVGMPPDGGNPSLTDEDLLNVVAWLRTLQ
jgi:mono/diheme cytochrome c family protein